MFNAINRLAVAAAILFSASAASALEYETVFRQGAWRTDVNMHDGGSLTCEALVSGASGVALSLVATQDGKLLVLFSKSGWNLAEGSVDYRFKVDRRSPWDIDGTGGGQSVSSRFNYDNGKVRRLFRELRNGSTLRLYSASGRQIDRFSLNGSAANLAALDNCRTLIVEAASGDPFAASGDPFR